MRYVLRDAVEASIMMSVAGMTRAEKRGVGEARYTVKKVSVSELKKREKRKAQRAARKITRQAS